MGINHQGKIVTDGLVLCLDAANPKSYDRFENLITHSASTSGITLGVIGSGGSLPTGWVVDQGQPGTTLEVVGFGVENNLNYIDLKFSGTTSSTNRWLIRPGNAVGVTAGITYSSSLYCKLISGTLDSTLVRQFGIINGLGTGQLYMTATLERYSGSVTSGSTSTVYPRLDIGFNSISSVMNFTIRVAGFQAETGPFTNDYYPTTGSQKLRGTTWSDLSGNGNHANKTNNGGYGGQVVYNPLGYFDFTVNSPASTAGAHAGNGFIMSTVIVPTVGNFTVSAFIKRDLNVKGQGDRETIFGNAGGADGWRFGVGDGGYIYYLIGGSGGVGYQEGTLGGNTLQDGKWHMMSAVFDRSGVFGSYKVYGYIDGFLSGSVTISSGAGGNIAFTAYTPGIGYGGCCDVFAGLISSVSAYNRALSATEIQQNFNATRGRYGI